MSKFESAELILKLYDLRREAKMREARNWIFSFAPTSVEDINRTMMDPEVGAYLRMVTSYWDMAATLVNHGAIDADMFNETAGEHIMVFSIFEPHLAELREQWKEPKAFANLEKLIMGMPDGADRIKRTQEFMKSIREQMAAAQNGEKAGEASA